MQKAFKIFSGSGDDNERMKYSWELYILKRKT